jgi:hypothetical protein
MLVPALAGLLGLACARRPASLAPPSEPVALDGGAPDGNVPVAPDGGVPDAAVGFDRVIAVFNMPEYGPCTRCHMKADNWPHLDRDPVVGWPLFEGSAQASKEPDIKSTLDLARRVLACVDQSSTERCVDSRGDPNDDPDLKMPTRFGYSPLSSADVAVVRQWVSDGAPAR